MEKHVYINSSFLNNQKRVEVLAWDGFIPLADVDRLVEEYFPGVPREKVSVGFHWRTSGMVRGAKSYLYLVLQAEGNFTKE